MMVAEALQHCRLFPPALKSLPLTYSGKLQGFESGRVIDMLFCIYQISLEGNLNTCQGT
jgi:hypothetical protein